MRRRRTKRHQPSDGPVAMTGPHLHERILQIMDGYPRGKVLDVPCGQGALASRLMNMGFQVYCGDLDPDWFRLTSGSFHLLDLNDPFPYKNDTFDWVTCVEGIEHLENPDHLIRETARVLRPGGRAMITTPNIMNIKSRLYFLLRSYTNNFRYIQQPTSQRELLALHVNPIPFMELKYLLNRNGFTIERISCNRYSRKYPWLMPFLIPVIRFFTRRKNRDARFLLTRPLLEGDILIVSAVKVDTQPIAQ